MNFMGSGIMKKFIIFILFVILLILIINIIQLIVFKPIKYGIYKKDIDKEREYIICEYVEVTGFFWRINYSNEGEQCRYVKLMGIDPCDICSYEILFGGNTFVFYGKYTENTYDSILEGEDYVTFIVEDWDIIKPIIRHDILVDSFFKPLGYLYKYDFLN